MTAARKGLVERLRRRIPGPDSDRTQEDIDTFGPTTEDVWVNPDGPDAAAALEYDAVFMEAQGAELARLQALLAPVPSRSGIENRMLWYAAHASDRPLNLDILASDCADAARFISELEGGRAPAPIEARELLADVLGVDPTSLDGDSNALTVDEAICAITRAQGGSAGAGEDLAGAAKAVVDLVEGFPGYGTATNALENIRLKDQPAWVRFYNSVAALSTQADDPEADLVRRFGDALLKKLRAAETKYGWSHAWRRVDWSGELPDKLLSHVGKGDPIDVAAYAAFAWHHGWSTAPAQADRLDQGEEHGLRMISRVVPKRSGASLTLNCGHTTYVDGFDVQQQPAATMWSCPKCSPKEPSK